MKKVAIYLRVSTCHQTTANQRLELEKYCERQDWKIAKVYEDEGLSGKNANRPALNQMLKDAANGKFEILCCWKIDRLARSTIDLLNILTHLQSAGVGFCSTTQAIDTTTSAGRMLMTFLGAISEFERETIVERVNAGLQRAKQQGIRLGRPRVGFDVNKALKLKQEGYSWSQVAREIKVSIATVRRMITPLLKNPSSETAEILAQ